MSQQRLATRPPRQHKHRPKPKHFRTPPHRRHHIPNRKRGKTPASDNPPSPLASFRLYPSVIPASPAVTQQQPIRSLHLATPTDPHSRTNHPGTSRCSSLTTSQPSRGPPRALALYSPTDPDVPIPVEWLPSPSAARSLPFRIGPVPVGPSLLASQPDVLSCKWTGCDVEPRLA